MYLLWLSINHWLRYLNKIRVSRCEGQRALTLSPFKIRPWVSIFTYGSTTSFVVAQLVMKCKHYVNIVQIHRNLLLSKYLNFERKWLWFSFVNQPESRKQIFFKGFDWKAMVKSNLHVFTNKVVFSNLYFINSIIFNVY